MNDSTASDLQAQAVARQPGRAIVAASIASTSTSLAAFMVGSLAIQIRQSLHLGIGSLGVTVSLYYLAAATGSIPAGWLAERLGGARMMRAASAAAGGALVLVAVIAKSWASLTVVLILAGLVSSAMGPATNLFLLRRIPDGHRGLAFGTKQAAVPFATLLGGLAVPGVGLTLGWRWAFVFGALVAAAAVVAAPRSRHSVAARIVSRQSNPPQVAALPLAVLSVGFGLGIFATSGLTTFLVLSAVAAGLGHAAAGYAAGLAAGSAVMARVAAGFVTDRRRRGADFSVVMLMLACGAVGYAALALGSAIRLTGLFIAGSVVAFGAGWGWNGVFQLAVSESHPASPARASGMTQVGGRLAGVLGPLAFSFAVLHGSYAVGWLVASAAALLSVAVILTGSRMLAAHGRQATA